MSDHPDPTTSPDPDEETPLDPVPDVATSVPDGEEAAARCNYCGRPFTSLRARALHRGQRHPEHLDEAERNDFEAARDAESDDLFFFHIRVVIALGVLYAMSVVVYMVVLGNEWI